MRETRVRAVQSGWHARVPLRHALEMPLVDDGAVHRHGGLPDAAPIERAIDRDRPPSLVPAADEAAGVWLDQQGSPVERVARRMRAVDADGVPCARMQEG